ncbi:6-phosphogluconolactonase [Pelagirhabdus alkalitolerans]|uniref:6-phosphogluconolactonase n=1 Tax=Pelagirhabdus alkalitolerans TaxID=1612202 RepID=A0A1G6GYL6_9BACI|nr:lactonase family protein [Pelagirhabdus alkalitolerans]SDB86765.1 6-phosphogluconolactonase [Pelagirhabdus alkalitolerans]
MSNVLTGYIGTYTKAESEGVYQFSLDVNEPFITEVNPVAKLDNPTYVTVSQDNNNLYATFKEGEEGGVVAFKIDQKTKQLTELNRLSQVGAPPCHVSVNRDRTMVVTANYHTKQIISYALNEDGSLKEVASINEHEGSGPHERQEKPHLHYAGFTPDEKYVVAIDLGSDEIWTYDVLEGGKLEKRNVFHAPAGSGPRHIVFAPNGQYAYTMTELTSEVLTLSYDEKTGEFKQIQAIKAIPPQHKTVNDGSAIHMTSDGRFVYVANRGHNSIALFEVDEDTHELKLIEWKSTEGDWPRDFVLSPCEKFVVASNQKSGTLTLFTRDEKTGQLELVQAGMIAPESVCVKFLNA